MKQLPESPNRKKLICIIGMDGAGKTAHSRALIDRLRESGIKCKYVWLGNAHFFDYPFMLVCRILGFTTTHQMNTGIPVSEHKYYKNKAVSEIWPWIRLLDVIFVVGLQAKLLLWEESTIVCDRFVPDIAVEVMVDVNNNGLYKKLNGRLLFGLIPRSALSVCLDVDEETARRRKSDIPGIEYLIRRRNAYRLVCHYLDIPIVNAEGPFVSVQQDLVEFVEGSDRRTPIAEPKSTAE